ncbi:DUF2789 family protein [Enterovibrio baiacu]|uniref:DUF2789 family protein n=1 Tax=Enterovibrio baiacu TaxID=2491023 RepID=UPI003D0B4465
MEVFTHNLESLFQQLGLPSDGEAISSFIADHPLTEGQALASAEFWSVSQRQFLEEAQLQDADWTEQIDTLDTLLRKS